MTVLSAVQLAAPWLGIEVPSEVFSATTREMVEMQAVVNEAAQQISDEHDWFDLLGIHTIAGDGSDVDFTLPSNYDRMTLDASLHSSTNTTYGPQFINSLEDWQTLEVQGVDYPYGRAIIYGGVLYIKPARADGENITFPYVKNTRVAPDGGGSNKALFTADDDTFVLSERLLKLAIVWVWKAQKKLDFVDDLQNYQIALAKEVSRDRGPSIITTARRAGRMGGNTAYPYALGS